MTTAEAYLIFREGFFDAFSSHTERIPIDKKPCLDKLNSWLIEHILPRFMAYAKEAQAAPEKDLYAAGYELFYIHVRKLEQLCEKEIDTALAIRKSV